MARSSRPVDASGLVVLAILKSGGKVFVVRRPAGAPLPDFWEFPGGKVAFGEHPWDALRREIREELGLRLGRGTLFGVYSHVYALDGQKAHYVLIAYLVPTARARLRETEHRRWVTPRALSALAVIPGSKAIVRDLRRRTSRRVRVT